MLRRVKVPSSRASLLPRVIERRVILAAPELLPVIVCVEKAKVSCQYQVADEQKCLVLSKLTFCPRCLVPTPQHSASCGTVG